MPVSFLAGVFTGNLAGSARRICHSIRDRFCSPLLAWQLDESESHALAAVSITRLPQSKISASDPQSLLIVSGSVHIYNRPELIALLGMSPLHVQSLSDVQLFAAGWARWQQGLLQKIVGAFAVAIWDQGQSELTLARDHTGDQALFFLHSAGLLAFASLPLPLQAINEIDTSLDEEQMVRILALLPGAPTQTLFKNIQRLPPGHLLTFKEKVVKVARYWHPINAQPTRYSRDQEYIEAFREIFDRAVSDRLETSGNIGSELSGGMDSGSVTATAARLLAGRKLTAFTAIPQTGFADVSPTGRFGNEGPAAALVADMYPNIEHVLVNQSEGSLVPSLSAGEAPGYPVFNPLNELWIRAILDECKRRGISVLLNGTCGNATLSSSGLIGLSEMFSKGQLLKLAALVFDLRRNGYTGLRQAASFALAPAIPSWLQRKLAPDANDFSFAFSPLRPEITAQYHLREQSFNEMHGHLSNVDDYRRKIFEYYDPGASNAAVSLGWGIELRDPTQDKRVFEFCYSMPIEQYLVGGQTRSLVRRSMRGRLPAATLACKNRGLQSADWYLTMSARRQELLDELALIRLSPMANRLLDLDRLQMLLENWPTTGFTSQEVIYSWHYALSRGIAAGHFIRRFE